MISNLLPCEAWNLILHPEIMCLQQLLTLLQQFKAVHCITTKYQQKPVVENAVKLQMQ